MMRHRQTKGPVTRRATPKPPRHSSTLLTRAPSDVRPDQTYGLFPCGRTSPTCDELQAPPSAALSQPRHCQPQRKLSSRVSFASPYFLFSLRLFCALARNFFSHPRRRQPASHTASLGLKTTSRKLANGGSPVLNCTHRKIEVCYVGQMNNKFGGLSNGAICRTPVSLSNSTLSLKTLNPDNYRSLISATKSLVKRQRWNAYHTQWSRRPNTYGDS